MPQNAGLRIKCRPSESRDMALPVGMCSLRRPTMERGSFLYEANGPEWRDAGLALDGNLDNPAFRELLPLYQAGLLLPPEER